MISLMCWYVERDLDEEGREKFRRSLEGEVPTQAVRRAKVIRSKESPDKKFVPVKGSKWKAPPGWKPPGWNEEKSYQASMEFMAFQRSPK